MQLPKFRFRHPRSTFLFSTPAFLVILLMLFLSPFFKSNQLNADDSQANNQLISATATATPSPDPTTVPDITPTPSPSQSPVITPVKVSPSPTRSPVASPTSTPAPTETPQPTDVPSPTPDSTATPTSPNLISSMVTFYGYADNTPPGTDIAFWNFRSSAGGVGSYSDPITFATDKSEWPVGTKLYLPYLQKYVIMEDLCGSCADDWQNHKYHIDVWMNSTSTFPDQLLQCENNWTRDATDIEVNPPSDRSVNDTPLFDPSSGTCLSN